MLDRAPEAPGPVPPASDPTGHRVLLEDLGPCLRLRLGESGGPRARPGRARRRPGRGRAPAAPRRPARRSRPSAARLVEHPPGEVEVVRRAASSCAKCSGDGAAAASVRSAGARCSGSSAGRRPPRPGEPARSGTATVGRPAPRPPPGPGTGTARRAPGSARSRAPPARRSAAVGGELALDQHVPGRRDRHRPRQRVRQVPGGPQHRRQGRLVGPHRGEGEVAVVDELQVGRGELDRGPRPGRSRPRWSRRGSRPASPCVA